MTRNLTERYKAEHLLRASAEKRRLALDAAELGMWHVEPMTRAGTTDARYRAIFGTTEEWKDYLKAVAVIHPDDQPAVLEAVTAATRLEDPAPYPIEYRIVHPVGLLRWILANGRASFEGIDSARRVTSFDGTVADITDRRRGEEVQERLVHVHGGSVAARSGGPGSVSEFVVRLPVALSLALNKPADEANPVRPTTRLRILVADDNLDAAESLAMLLSLEGNETRTAHDGLEALDVAAAFRPDV